MIRRHAISGLAVLALGLMVAASAEAGGTSGAVGVKKNATVLVKNGTTAPLYVLVVPGSLATSDKFGEIGTVGWAKNLGAVLVNAGSTVAYPVPAGPGVITYCDPDDVSPDPSDDLPTPSGPPINYTVAKGKTVKKTISLR